MIISPRAGTSQSPVLVARMQQTSVTVNVRVIRRCIKTPLWQLDTADVDFAVLEISEDLCGTGGDGVGVGAGVASLLCLLFDNVDVMMVYGGVLCVVAVSGGDGVTDSTCGLGAGVVRVDNTSPKGQVRERAHAGHDAIEHAWVKRSVVESRADLVKQRFAKLLRTLAFPNNVCDVTVVSTAKNAGVVFGVAEFGRDDGVPRSSLLDNLEKAAVGLALCFV